jgi:hypothetical protein
MANVGRLIAVITAVVLVVAAAVFFLFRQPLFSEGLYRVETAVGLDATPLERHVVSENFKGWAVVHYAVDGAPPLREEEGALIIEYPANGRLETSTPAPADAGLLHRAYYRRTASGLAPLSRAGDIWGEYSHLVFPGDLGVVGDRYSGFFVGTMKEFLETEWPAEHSEPEAIQE